MSTDLVPKADIQSKPYGQFFVDTYTLISMSGQSFMDVNEKLRELMHANPQAEFMVESVFNGINIRWRPNPNYTATQGESN